MGDALKHHQGEGSPEIATDAISDKERAQSSGTTSGGRVAGFDNDLLLRLLRCQSQVLGHITRKSSSAATFAPIFATARDRFSPRACGIEIRSPRSGLVYHLAQEHVSAEILKLGERRPLEAEKSVGALCVKEGQAILLPDLHKKKRHRHFRRIARAAAGNRHASDLGAAGSRR